MIIRAPTINEPLSATWARDVIDVIRRQRVSVVHPLVVSIAGPDGMTISLARQAAASTQQLSSKGCWELSIDGNEATCSNCYLQTASIMVGPPPGTDDLTASLDSSGQGWLCAAYHTDTKVLSMQFGSAPESYDEDDPLLLVPLYKLRFNDDDDGKEWQVEFDARTMPRLGVYI